MTDLTKKRCVPCEGGVPKLSAAQAKALLKQTPSWRLRGGKISKSYRFKDFAEAMAFVSKVARLAEKEGHHPDIFIFSWNRVTLTLWTHAIGGLSENDFIVAAKIDRIR